MTNVWMSSRRFLSAAVFAGLAACATGPTPYEPARSVASFGYTDQAIELNRYRVTFRGQTATEARTLALRRAAELTLQDGRDWFQVVDSYTQGFGGGGSGSSISIGGATGGRNSSIGVGIGFPIGGGSTGPSEVEVGLEIVTGEGEKPDDPNAYSASSIIETASSVPVQ
ncbi:MAG: hypothetical protein AAFS13_03970 [Pseudomonadota bacterium]